MTRPWIFGLISRLPAARRLGFATLTLSTLTMTSTITALVTGSVASSTVAAAEPELKTYYLLVFNTPADGLDAEYNRWYDEQHVPDLLRTPGVVAAQRFKLAPTQLSPKTPPHQYMTMFTIKTRDLPGLFEVVNSRVRNGETVIPAALNPKTGQMYTLEAMGPVHTPATLARDMKRAKKSP